MCASYEQRNKSARRELQLESIKTHSVRRKSRLWNTNNILLSKNSSTLRDLFVKWEWFFLYLGFSIMWHIGNTCLLLLLYPEQKTFWCRTDRYLIMHSTCIGNVQCNIISSWYNCKKLCIWTNDYQSTHSLYYCSIFIIYSCSIHTTEKYQIQSATNLIVLYWPSLVRNGISIECLILVIVSVLTFFALILESDVIVRGYYINLNAEKRNNTKKLLLQIYLDETRRFQKTHHFSLYTLHVTCFYR